MNYAHYVICPHCSYQMMNDPLLAGQAVACPNCNGHLQMPGVPMPQVQYQADPQPYQTTVSSRLRTGKSQPPYLAMLFISLILVSAGVVVWMVVNRSSSFTKSVNSKPVSGQNVSAGAREKLKTCLDGWNFGEDAKEFKVNHPDIIWMELSHKIGNVILQEYEILNGRLLKESPGEVTYEFIVVLTFEQVRGEGAKKRARYWVTWIETSQTWSVARMDTDLDN